MTDTGESQATGNLVRSSATVDTTHPVCGLMVGYEGQAWS